jgi:cell division initiation protein
MWLMDASQSALDSLRTVEFRETLKGYHRDDVDEYLEKAAVEAEGLQEQLRQSGDRLRQAAERISQLESQLEAQLAAPVVGAVATDDTLQRTLLLAQKFVDETKAESEAEAAKIIAEADTKARLMTDQAQAQATQIAAESEQRLREEINRLESARGKLSNEVETMSRHLENERHRLRTALGDILKWVDDNVHPTTTQVDLRPEPDPERGADATAGPGTAPLPAVSEGNRPAANRAPDVHSPQVSGTGPTGEVTQMHPTATTTGVATTNAPLPL